MVLMGFPQVPDLELVDKRNRLATIPLIGDGLGLPLHLLATTRSERTCAKALRHHLVSGEVPRSFFVEDYDLNVRLTTPLATLFTLSRTISDVHLLMAMYEFCGSFTLFHPSDAIEKYLHQDAAFAPLGACGGWSRVHDVSGKPTDLWRRPPLVEIVELHAFAREVEHLRGGKRFAKLAQMVTGVAASPFEVQTSLLLGLSRAAGGEGLGGFMNNHEISLTRDAQKIAGKTRVYVDLYYEGDGVRPPLAIECQGGMVHGSEAATLSDADRMVALQKMGIDVLPLTYRQIADRDNFERIARHIAHKLGRTYREKSERFRAKERDLRAELFIDWLTLGE